MIYDSFSSPDGCCKRAFTFTFLLAVRANACMRFLFVLILIGSGARRLYCSCMRSLFFRMSAIQQHNTLYSNRTCTDTLAHINVRVLVRFMSDCWCLPTCYMYYGRDMCGVFTMWCCLMCVNLYSNRATNVLTFAC